MNKNSLFEQCLSALYSTSQLDKPNQVLVAFQQYLEGEELLPQPAILGQDVGFPKDLNWVSPKDLPRRKLSQAIGRAGLLHAICHIEFNAINLALDAICRFPEMPLQYYEDWLKVAAEESYHFQLLQSHLVNLGYKYGSFPVHDGLWQMAKDTAYDPLVRMACVPRLLEARGLDVAPQMAANLQKQGDAIGAGILGIIFQDEIEHVHVGNRWYHYLCKQRQIDPLKTFTQCVAKHAPEFIRGPLNESARLKAGFLQNEMDFLADIVNNG